MMVGGAVCVSSSAMAVEPSDCLVRGVLDAPTNQTVGNLRDECQAAGALPADKDTRLFDCIRERAAHAETSTTVEDIRNQCSKMIADGKVAPKKYLATRAVEENPYVISPLRQNYILPYTYNDEPNQAPYQLAGERDLVENEEAKLQVSLKVPLTFTDLLTANDAIYFGFTLKSFWQVYNDDISAPFRETNYRPEVFYQAPLALALGDGMWFGRLGFEHESNGRTQYLSRSWNRTYAALGYAEEEWGLMIQPWYRLPEDEKVDDGNPDTPPESKGDDNPDIEDYMGYFEMTGAYRTGNIEFTGMVRRNFDEGKGAQEVGMSFPLWGRLRGYAQYFEGYGESMIDYDHKNRRIGVGVLLTDML